MKNRLKNDESGVAVLETTIYFPLVLLAFFGFIMASLFFTQRVVLDRAVARATTEAAAWLSGDIMRFGRFTNTPGDVFGQRSTVSIRTNPYVGLFNRFDPMDRGSFDNRIRQRVQDYAGWSVIGSFGSDIQVDVSHSWYFIASDLHVTATQSLNFPINLSMFGLDWHDTGIQLRSSSSARIFRTGQVVDNINFAFDATRRLFSEFTGNQNVHPSALQGFMGNLPTLVNNMFGINGRMNVPD
ncbi:MAG: pilus assembly protein [Turicibacter sp.]|nr:pilus assembly protein [Turicibacter sp.]